VTPGGRWTHFFLVALAALLPSLRVLQGDFVADDFGCLRLWGEKPLREFLVFGDISEGIWGIPLDEARPVDALSFRLGHWISGADASGHLGLALAFHVACSLLVFALTRLACPGAPPRAAVAAGMLFAVHPVHAEAIAWVSGKVDSLATLFYLACLALYLRWRVSGSRLAYAAAVLLFGLGLLAKEVLLTLPALLVGADLLLGPAGPPRARLLRVLRGARAYAPFAVLAASYLLARRWAFGSAAREQRFDSGLSAAILERQAFQLGELFAPAPAWATLLLAASAATALVLLARDRDAARRVALPCLLFGFFFYGVTSAPLVLTYLSARHLYLPSAGLAIAAGLLLHAADRARFARVLVLVGALCALTPALYARELAWIDAGRESRRLRSAVEEATRDLPLGAIVILWGVPATSGEVLAWRAALPFALEQPFVARDVASSLRLIESPDLYCCPVSRWWLARAATLDFLETGPADESVVVHLLEWKPESGRLVRRDAALRRAALRERLERAGLSGAERGRGLKDAGRLVSVLAQAARTAPRAREERR